MSQFKENNYQQAQASNELINQSLRNDTMVSEELKQSTFNKSFTQPLTFNSGKLVPFLLQEVLPTDNYKVKEQVNIKLSAPASNPFNKIVYDVAYFFVPSNQIDKEFKYVMGETDIAGAIESNIPFPKLKFTNPDGTKTAPSLTWRYDENDLATYFNIPIHVDMFGSLKSIQLYPALAYGKIWNDWYRDENLQNIIDISSWYDNREIIPSMTSDEFAKKKFYETIKYYKGLAPVSKLPDYFTTTLPYRQKGSAINLGGTDSLVLKPLTIRNAQHPETLDLFNPKWYTDKGAFQPSSIVGTNGSGGSQTWNAGGTGSGININLALKTEQTSNPFIAGAGFNVNDLRDSLVAQHYLENLALMGSRYVEQLKSIWKIDINPLEIDRVECIGGMSDILVFNNVQQTSETSSTSPLGKIASSLYNSVMGEGFDYSATQHGWIIGVLCVRTPINYGGQGLPKIFDYDEALDLYNPLFRGLGEQPIQNQELYLKEYGYSENIKAFGFNEPFLNTKYNISNASGFLSLNSKTSLFSQYLYGEKYTDTPILSDNFMQFNPNIIGNTLFKVDNVNLEFYHQFLAEINLDIEYTSQQSLYDLPGVKRV